MIRDQFLKMEPAAKRRKYIGEKMFDFLPRISTWEEIKLDKVFKIKQVEKDRAFLVSSGEGLITTLPDMVLKKISQDEDLSVYLKKTSEDVIVCFKPRKMCPFCKKYYANSSSLTLHKRKHCKSIKDVMDSSNGYTVKEEIIDTGC